MLYNFIITGLTSPGTVNDQPRPHVQQSEGILTVITIAEQLLDRTSYSTKIQKYYSHKVNRAVIILKIINL